MDIRAAQQILMQRRIPKKRNYQERTESDGEEDEHMNDDTSESQNQRKRQIVYSSQLG